MKVIVAGSRDYVDREAIYAVLDAFHKKHNFTAVISGLARGPDMIGKEWADERGIDVLPFPADWNKNGLSAGHMRNSDMAAVQDSVLISFWDGKSSGTKDMIKKMKDRILHSQIVEIIKENDKTNRIDL